MEMRRINQPGIDWKPHSIDHLASFGCTTRICAVNVQLAVPGFTECPFDDKCSPNKVLHAFHQMPNHCTFAPLPYEGLCPGATSYGVYLLELVCRGVVKRGCLFDGHV